MEDSLIISFTLTQKLIRETPLPPSLATEASVAKWFLWADKLASV